MDDDVVRRVQALALKLLGDDRHRAVRLVAHDAPAAVLARELPPFVVERVAVAVARRIAEHRHAAVVFDPAHLHVVGDVAPHQIAPDAVPRQAFGPQRADVQPPDHRVADDVAPEARIERDDVRDPGTGSARASTSRAAWGPETPAAVWPPGSGRQAARRPPRRSQRSGTNDGPRDPGVRGWLVGVRMRVCIPHQAFKKC